MKISTLSLHKKLLILGTLLTISPLFILSFVSLKQSKAVDEAVETGTKKLATQDLEHIVSSIYNMNRIQQELLQKAVSDSLNIAREKLNNKGKIRISKTESTQWNVVNQYTKKSENITLEKLYIGDSAIEKNYDIHTPSPIVDSVKNLVGGTCTLFQRINQKGDMLRVSTNVETLENKRAIGTYIPAINPNGTRNPVVSTLLSGKTYSGKAYVVNDWYITSYEPIYDEEKEIVGALYYGIRQEAGSELRKIIQNIKIGDTGYVYVINSKGEYIISQNGMRNKENILNAKDQSGNYFIKEIIENANASNEGEIFEQSYPWTNSPDQEAKMKIAKLSYYKPWDWIIGASVYEDEIYEVGSSIHKIAKSGLNILVWTLISSLIICVLIWRTVSKNISGEIIAVSDQMKSGSIHVKSTAQEIAQTSQTLAEGASEQASSLEETSASIEEITAMTHKNMESAKEADLLAENCNKLISDANETMSELNISMNGINEASQETAKIMKTINEIAFQTNVLALNAAVEAARAGEAGAGFSIVAEEVRNLAMRSSDAAQTTATIVNANIERIDSGHALALKTKEVFEGSKKSVEQVSTLVNEIATASEEGCKSLNHINAAITNIDQVVQETTARAEESASASHYMKEQSVKMNSMVIGLSKLVEGESKTKEQNPDKLLEVKSPSFAQL